MPMAVSSAAHPDRIKHIYRKAVKEITAAAGPSGVSVIDTLDSTFDALDKSDEALSNGGILAQYLTVVLIKDILKECKYNTVQPRLSRPLWPQANPSIPDIK